MSDLRDRTPHLCHICKRPKDGPGELWCSYPHPLDRGTGTPLPENLTHCGGCGQAFADGPVTNWNDYFADVEDAGFFCGACAEREGVADEEFPNG